MPENSVSLRDMLTAGRDPLAEATRGRYHWNDPGMDALETGWEEFMQGQRVEILTPQGWVPGTIRVCDPELGGIEIECDVTWHENMNFLAGKGASVPILGNTRRGIWSSIRGIGTPMENIEG